MKLNWNNDELYEHFLILEEEIELTKGFTGIKKIGFLVILKYFQMEACFPESKEKIPIIVIEFIAEQLKKDKDAFGHYKLEGPTYVRHKQLIRKFFSFSEYSSYVDDVIKSKIELFPYWYDMNKLRVQVLQEFRNLKYEPPIANKIERLVNSIHNQRENEFFDRISKSISETTKNRMEFLLRELEITEDSKSKDDITFNVLKSDPGRIGLESIFKEVTKLQTIRSLLIPNDFLNYYSTALLNKYKLRVASELPSEIKAHPAKIRHSYLSIFFYLRSKQITDNLVELLIQLIHKFTSNAENKVVKEFVKDFKRVSGKYNILLKMAENSLKYPDEIVRNVIYPIAKEETLNNLVKELKNDGNTYRVKVFNVIRNSYSKHYRRMLPKVLDSLEFRSNNQAHQPVIKALHFISTWLHSNDKYIQLNSDIPIDGIIKQNIRKSIIIEDREGNYQIDKKEYEILVLQALRDKLRCKEIWVEGSENYKNPELDLPQDFESRRDEYYSSLRQPKDPGPFIAKLKNELAGSLIKLNKSITSNKEVKISQRKGGRIAITPFEKQASPKNIEALKEEISNRWPMIDLLDIIKETDLRVHFTNQIHTTADREILDKTRRRKRLLLVLFGLGTNTGLKRLSNATSGEIKFDDLRYIKRKYLNKDNLRNANIAVVNQIQQIRTERIWGQGTSSCASDSKKFGAWDQNLMTEWHIRYRGRGVMIYWHVERKSTCIYSQLKSVSSSEVAAMIEGVLRHCTNISIDRNYVDSHGQSEVAFAFSYLLNFSLMPRFKNISKKKLYIPDTSIKSELPHLSPILSRTIDWDLISEQYDQMIKYSTALKLGTSSAEAILKRFTRNSLQHPTYKALQELGKVVKSIFLCQYIESKDLRIEINQGLNIVENWNSANSFVFYGKSGEISTNNIEDQELSVLCLHLLQNCLVYINTLMIQEVLDSSEWQNKMESEDMRALSPLIYAHINPYGRFELNMEDRINLNNRQLRDT